MRKCMCVLLAALLVLMCAAGCHGQNAAPNELLPGAEGISGITVTSMPEGYHYFFSGEQAVTLAESILEMNVISEYPEDPNVYAGMTWVITAQYEDGLTATVYLFGNMFIRSGDGPWFKVSINEAENFERLLTSLS